MEIVIKILQFVLSLSILVIIHELGHFLAAKAFKIWSTVILKPRTVGFPVIILESTVILCIKSSFICFPLKNLTSIPILPYNSSKWEFNQLVFLNAPFGTSPETVTSSSALERWLAVDTISSVCFPLKPKNAFVPGSARHPATRNRRQLCSCITGKSRPWLDGVDFR